MPKHLLTVAISAAMVSGCGSMVKEKPSSSANASPLTGYLTNSSGDPIKLSGDGCMRSGSWTQEQINNACEGIDNVVAESKQEQKPKPVVEKLSIPEPIVKPVDESVAETVEPEQQTTVETVVLNSRALFANDAFKLSDRGGLAMQNLVSKLGEYTKIEKIEIVGYTDSVGTEKYNQILSEKRANTIRGFIFPSYNDAELSVQGMGEADPVSSNNSPEGRQQNRRVEIRVTASLVKTQTV